MSREKGWRIPPARLGGRFVLKVLRFFRRIGRMAEKEIREHLTMNAIAFHEYCELHPKERFIERQGEMDCFCFGHQHNLLSKLLFRGEPLNGSMNMCEVIAVYNTLCALHDNVSETLFPRLLARFEKKGLMLHGYFGTNPEEMLRFFNHHGYRTGVVVGNAVRKERVKELEDNYDAFILTAFEDAGTVFSMIHTVSITRVGNKAEGSGGFVLHNEGPRADREKNWYPSLFHAVQNFEGGDTFPLYLIGVSRTGRKIEPVKAESENS